MFCNRQKLDSVVYGTEITFYHADISRKAEV